MADGTPSGNTPTEQNNAGTPPVAPQTPSQPSNEEIVVLTKTDYNELARKASITETAQRDAANASRKLAQFGKKKLEQPEFLSNTELIKARNLITEKVLTNGSYQELTRNNPEIAKALMKDPSLLLDVDEFTDAQDLADQVFDYLDNRIVSTTPPVTPPAPTPSNPAPLPSGANPPANAVPAKSEAEVAQERAEEESKGRPPVDRIAAKIAGRIQSS